MNLKKLKSAATALFAMALSLMVLPSCQQDQYGYPDIVKLSSDGVPVTIYGDTSFQTMNIHDSKGTLASPIVNDSNYMVVSLHWLSIKTLRGSHSLELDAQPNTSGAPRSLFIDGNFGNGYTCIEVIQN